MASVFNSKNIVYNLDSSGTFTGRWEDIQSYTSVINTIKTGTDTSGTVRLDWLNMADDTVPSTTDAALVTDSFTLPADAVTTKQFDTRARWFRLRIEGTGASLNRISTDYKKAPTEIKLTDDTTNIVSVNLGDNTLNSMYTVLTDQSGSLLGTTNDLHTGEALYTHLADASGSSLATTDNQRDIQRTLVTGTDVSFVFTIEEPTVNQGTLIPSTNSFRLRRTEIPFKDGDSVRFAVAREGEDTSIGTIFSDTTDTSGYLKITSTVKYTKVETSHVEFQLLVNYNMADWFNPLVGFTNPPMPATVSLNAMTLGNPALTASLATVAHFLDASGSGNTTILPKVEDYYNIIADVSGFDSSAAGVRLEPGAYPIDLRFYRGSLESSGTNVHSFLFDLSVASDPLESLSVALRDNNNVNLVSTGTNATGYYFKLADISQQNILYLADATTNYNVTGITDAVAFQDVLDAFKGISEDIDVLVTDASGVASVIVYTDEEQGANSVTQHNSAYNNFTMKRPSDAWKVGNLYYSDVNYGGINSILKANTTPDYIQALARYSQRATLPVSAAGDYANAFTSSLDAIVVFTTVSGYVGTTVPIAGYSAKLEQDVYDSCSTFFQGVKKYIITPESMEDHIAFTGTPDNVFTFRTDSQVNYEADLTTARNSIVNRLVKIDHVGNNALAVHTSDVCGHSQAGTQPITDAKFGTSALYYALADSCGTRLDTTKMVPSADASNNNALYVSLVTRTDKTGATTFTGQPVTETYPLHITFEAAFHNGLLFDMTVSGVPVTTPDISSATFNLNTLGIANETAAPIWLKVYDISAGRYDELRADNDASLASAVELSGHIVYNLAVPGLEYRDLQFPKPVKFTNGLYVVASTNYKYDSFQFPPGNKHIFVHGNYTIVS